MLSKDDRLIRAVEGAYDEFARGFTENAIVRLGVTDFSGLLDRARVGNPKLKDFQTDLYNSGAHDPSTVVGIALGIAGDLGLSTSDLHQIRMFRNDIAHNKVDASGTRVALNPGAVKPALERVCVVLQSVGATGYAHKVNERLRYYLAGAPESWAMPEATRGILPVPPRRAARQKRPPAPPKGTLSPDQVDAIGRFTAWWKGTGRRFVITGPAGTGKTRLIPELVAAAGLKPAEVRLLAPTNKACEVLRQKFRAGDGFRTQVRTSAGYLWRFAPPTFDGEDLKFTVLGTKPFDPNAKLVVCDEASMLRVKDVKVLEEGYRVVYLGDPQQLPPVVDREETDPGERESDVLARPDVSLVHMHRVESAPSLYDIATDLRSGILPSSGVWEDGCARVLDEERGEVDRGYFEQLLSGADAVLVARNVTRIRLNQRMRELKGRVSYPGDLFPKPGEPLVATESMKDGLPAPGISNGDRLIVTKCVGEIERVKRSTQAAVKCLQVEVYREEDPQQMRMVVPVSLEMLAGKHVVGDEVDTRAVAGSRSGVLRCEWGYALTVHKAQGSEWRNVVVVDHAGHAGMGEIRWNYVAMTRARTQLTVVRLRGDTGLVF